MPKGITCIKKLPHACECGLTADTEKDMRWLRGHMGQCKAHRAAVAARLSPTPQPRKETPVQPPQSVTSGVREVTTQQIWTAVTKAIETASKYAELESKYNQLVRDYEKLKAANARLVEQSLKTVSLQLDEQNQRLYMGERKIT